MLQLEQLGAFNIEPRGEQITLKRARWLIAVIYLPHKADATRTSRRHQAIYRTARHQIRTLRASRLRFAIVPSLALT